DPVLVIERAGDEVLRLVTTAGNRQAERTLDAGAERRALHQRVPRAHLRRVAGACSGLVDAAYPQGTGDGVRTDTLPVGRVVSDVVHLAVLGERHPPGALASATALRRDLDHAVRCRGAVECRRGRPLQDFDALDVLGIDIVDPRDALAAQPDRKGARIVVHGDAVDDEQRLVRKVDAGRAADTHARARAGRAGALQDRHA